MTHVEDNEFPYQTFVETAAPATPSSGRRRWYFDPTDHLFKVLDSSGVTLVGGLYRFADSLLAVDTASFDFQNIPAGYKALRIEVQGQSTAAATNDNVKLTFNNDGGGNYDVVEWAFGPSTTFGAGAFTEGFAAAGITRIMTVPGASSSAGDVGNATIVVPDYASTTFNKSVHAEGGALYARSTGNIRLMQAFAAWRSTAAINRVTLAMTTGNWKAGSRATVYLEA